MSTQELIAAALTAADKLRWIGRYQVQRDDVIEACARAMVQPDIAEVERLLCAHESAIRQHDRGAEWDEAPSATRAALLDAVRAIAAERDQFRDAAKMVSAAEVPMPEPLYDGYDQIDRFLRNNLDDDDYAEYISGLQQYGDAREAARYAAGGKDAERYRLAKLHGWPEYRREIHPNPNGVPQWGYSGHWFDSPDAAIDAVICGEVKP